MRLGTPTREPSADTPLYLDPLVNGVDLLCQKRKTATVLYGIAVSVLRQLWGSADNFPINVPAARKWDEDAQKTGIWIDTEHRWEDEHPEMRPAIRVELSGMAYQSETGKRDGVVGSLPGEAGRSYARKGACTISLVHFAKTSGEACALADATDDLVGAFADQIRKDFCFRVFAIVSRVPLAVAQRESSERLSSSVNIAAEWEDTWDILVEAPLLKEIVFLAGQRALSGGILGSPLEAV